MSVKAMRERAGLTQVETGEKLGVDHSTVVGWEKGKWMPRTARCIQMTKLFNCTMDELFAPEQPRNEDVPF